MKENGFIREVHGGVHIYTIPAFSETGCVRHGFSTRLGGVSTGTCQSLNLGYKRKDKREAVTENFRRFCTAAGVTPEDMVFTDQVHKDQVAVVTRQDRGKGFSRSSDIMETDGLVTDQNQLALVTFYADCVPLFFLDPIHKVIALSHAGWRGTVAGIARNTLKIMEERFGSDPADCLAAIGPSIGSCCFEVDAPVAQSFSEAFPKWESILITAKGPKYHIDLWTANRLQLEDSGVAARNITIASLCTCCSKDVFFSHRGDAGQTGSMAAVLMLV